MKTLLDAGCYTSGRNGHDVLLRVVLPASAFDPTGMPFTSATDGSSKHGTIHLMSDFQQLSTPLQPQSRYGSRFLQRLLEAIQHPVKAV